MANSAPIGLPCSSMGSQQVGPRGTPSPSEVHPRVKGHWSQPAGYAALPSMTGLPLSGRQITYGRSTTLVPQAPAAPIEPQLEMAHVTKNTTDMHASPGSSRAFRSGPVRPGSGRPRRDTEQGRDRRRHGLGGAAGRLRGGLVTAGAERRLWYQDRIIPASFVKRMSSPRRPRIVVAGQAVTNG